uniref:Uncharacterized protein n=1 Tax=Rhizobium rhizogenes TaxID=359 RepID=A0A7S5DSX8_RHIRH|nr:hypothetical protein pC6.5b_358 [Rhizobium rhizogenes]
MAGRQAVARSDYGCGAKLCGNLDTWLVSIGRDNRPILPLSIAERDR